jgi:ABC-2 type transport system permease protein
MSAALDKFHAILRRDLLTAVRHRTGFVLSLVAVLVQLAAFFFLSKAIGPNFRPNGVEYFPFLLVGTGLYTFFVMSTQAFLNTVQEAQQTGTMEVLMTTSTSPAELLVLSSISAFAGNLVNLVIYVAAGVALFRASVNANIAASLLVMLLSLALALALGMLAATLQITFQKGSALVWLLGSGLWFLSGAMFPVQTLPRPLVILAHAFPPTYAIEGMRLALLKGEPLGTIAPVITILLGFSAILLPLAVWGLSFAVQRARRNGTLSFY